jgi:hypothetical protein
MEKEYNKITLNDVKTQIQGFINAHYESIKNMEVSSVDISFRDNVLDIKVVPKVYCNTIKTIMSIEAPKIDFTKSIGNLNKD